MSHRPDPLRQQRILMQPRGELLRGVTMVGRYNYASAQRPLSLHKHPGAIEICYLVRGYQTYQVHGDLHRLRGGDVFITRPDEVHSTAGQPEEKGVLYWLILKADHGGQGFWGLPNAEAVRLWNRLLSLPDRQFRGLREMSHELDAFTRIYHDKAAPLRATAMQNHLLRFFLLVSRAADQTHSAQRYSPITKVLRAIAENPSEAYNNEAMAKLAGLSEPRFKARFKEEVGVPPREYLTRHRLELACEALKRGRASITEIAFELGFPSSQYFATCFKRYYNCTPTDYLTKAAGQEA